MAKRNTYTPEYKAKIVIEILEGEQTISEIASREGINVNQLKNWKEKGEHPLCRTLSDPYRHRNDDGRGERPARRKRQPH